MDELIGMIHSLNTWVCIGEGRLDDMGQFGTAFGGVASDWDSLGGIRRCGTAEVACISGGLGRRL